MVPHSFLFDREKILWSSRRWCVAIGAAVSAAFITALLEAVDVMAMSDTVVVPEVIDDILEGD
jgi:hypothetical protein